MAGPDMELARNEKITLAVLAGFALVCLAAGAKMSPGASVKTPAAVTEAIPPFIPPPGRPVLGPDQHIGGVVYTPHRYPPSCGSDLTVAIHRGMSTLSLPADGDMLWLSAPPSEEML